MKMVHSFTNWVILVLTFVQCVQSSSQNYTHRLYIDNDKYYHLSWKFDDKEIEFEVLVNTTGYVGFGLSRDRTMVHSDVVIGEVKNGQFSLKDYHGSAKGTLVEDSVQNWSLISANQTNNQTKLIFKRTLITNDRNDMDITSDTMRVIWAYSDEEFNKENFTVGGYKSLHLLQIQRPDINIPDNHINVTVTVNQNLVPNDTTTYWCQRMTVPTFKEKMHVIKISPIVTEGNELAVHHMILYICKTQKTVLKDEKGHRCYAMNMPENWEGCRSSFFAWAIGGSSFPLPKHVGLPLGDTAEQRTFILEIHYDNPERKTDIIDSSGFELILVPATRDFDAGILEIGYYPSTYDQDAIMKIPPYQTAFRYQSVCHSDCIYDVFPPKSKSVIIKMFATLLHGHLFAKALILHHYRNGQEIARISADMNYDFNYQEMVFLNKEIEFLPGDDFKVQCVYNSKSETKFTLGGLTTREEMCLAFIMYYPKVNTALCESTIMIHDTVWLGNTLKPENAVIFKNQNVSEKFEKTMNGLGRNSSLVTICSDGHNYIMERKNPMDFYNLLQFQKPDTTEPPIIKTKVSSKAGISFLNVLGYSLRMVFLAGVLLYSVIL